MTATLTCFVDDEARRRVAKLRARAFVGPAPGVVAFDGDGRLVVHLPDGTEANARALAGHVLAPGERAAAIVTGDDANALGYVYQGRDGGGVQRLAAELGDGGDAGSDARAAIQRQFGLDVLADGTGLRERLRREYGDDHVRYDELHFYAQQLADATDPDTGLRRAAVRNDPEARVREVVAEIDDDALTAALDAEDWEWLAGLAADHTTRPPVAYEPDHHDVV
ncbi:hypothetical protein G9C85_18080 [Halorubellus sp. JP-L1]|uniref:hypothetical protein n=1 Tax=Halorubellus sp. JP-L1 TaxID=2715753 RepID=UPI00140BE5F2|nr:hypothetical protein [Halorubellus sp. JP-L1]NHN43531.1 hypothetical protein [Halorubellus sp. JP-L1]